VQKNSYSSDGLHIVKGEETGKLTHIHTNYIRMSSSQNLFKRITRNIPRRDYQAANNGECFPLPAQSLQGSFEETGILADLNISRQRSLKQYGTRKAVLPRRTGCL
jgi:hypothetical protein